MLRAFNIWNGLARSLREVRRMDAKLISGSQRANMDQPDPRSSSPLAGSTGTGWQLNIRLFPTIPARLSSSGFVRPRMFAIAIFAISTNGDSMGLFESLLVAIKGFAAPERSLSLSLTAPGILHKASSGAARARCAAQTDRSSPPRCSCCSP